MERVCWLCGRNGVADPLDKHHIFGGAYRSKSDKLGLTVYLCHHDCHIFGPDAVHRNAETMQRLHEYGQRLAMEHFGWTEDEFRNEFGKSYLRDVSKLDTEAEDVSVVGFALIPDAVELPY